MRRRLSFGLSATLVALALAGCGGTDADVTTAAAPVGTAPVGTAPAGATGAEAPTTATDAAPAAPPVTAPVSFPQSPGGRTVNGIRCESREFAVTHVHASLQMVFGGARLVVPANVGIDQERQCLYWLHTHTAAGVLHVESPTEDRTFTLGDLFAVWGGPLGPGQVLDHTGQLYAWVGGRSWTADPATIPLTDRQEIVLSDRDLSPDERPPPDWSELG